MNPRLAVMAGPLEGKIIPLDEKESSIGRERSNSVWINDLSVSRRHSVIIQDGNEFKLKDLGSHNGTKVNGTPIGERILEHGDMIAMGDSLLLFLLHEDQETPVATESVLISEDQLEIQSTTVLRIEDAIYLHPDKVLAALPPAARMARDLNTLLRVSSAISSITGVEALETKLVELLFDTIPAEHAAILLLTEKSDDFSSIFARSRLGDDERAVQISRTIVEQVRQDNVGVLCNDVLESEAFKPSDSLIASRIQSLMCVPMAMMGSLTGVLYLDTCDRSVRFDGGHLQLVTAIAAIGAAAIRNAQNFERLEAENRRLNVELNIEHNVVGESARMRDVFQFIARAAPTDSTVLIEGESGTGKELVARAIHRASRRHDKAFVAINCAALTDTLLESELFGHEKGAFTGAIAQKKGKLEVADGGTVFLDEIGELAPVLQAKLLRALQAAGSGLVYSTYLGHRSTGYGIAVDGQGSAYSTGWNSGDTSFPTGPFVISTDNGASWKAASNGLPDADITTPPALDPSNPEIMYATLESTGLFKTSDRAEHWTRLTSGLPTGPYYVGSIAVDPLTPTTVYAGVSHSLPPGFSAPPPLGGVIQEYGWRRFLDARELRP